MKPKKPDEILACLKEGMGKKEIVKKLGVSYDAVVEVRKDNPEICLTKKGEKRKPPKKKKERTRPRISFRTSPEMFDKVESAREDKGESVTVFMNNLLEEWGSV